jgi:hypothetical protein
MNRICTRNSSERVIRVSRRRLMNLDLSGRTRKVRWSATAEDQAPAPAWAPHGGLQCEDLLVPRGRSFRRRDRRRSRS